MSQACLNSIPVIRSVSALRLEVANLRNAGRTIGFVPTMGALHDGHISLGELARARGAAVIYSIFVNPAQFAPHEDFARYPRDEQADVLRLATEDVCDLVYAPDPDEMYPEGFGTSISVGGPSEGLETDFRPHFFGGVAIVVAKLLLQVLPDFAVFGEKDYQQLQVIRRMAADLDLPVEIIGGPTQRESDGLAMSSRNAYLDAAQRKVAGRLNLVLKDVIARIHGGDRPEHAEQRPLHGRWRAPKHEDIAELGREQRQLQHARLLARREVPEPRKTEQRLDHVHEPLARRDFDQHAGVAISGVPPVMPHAGLSDTGLSLPEHADLTVQLQRQLTLHHGEPLHQGWVAVFPDHARSDQRRELCHRAALRVHPRQLDDGGAFAVDRVDPDLPDRDRSQIRRR